jgi:hypothetical protein
MSEKCHHHVFDAQVEVNRIEDIGRFTADVRITCRECGVPMRFLGLPLGLDYNSATVSFDGLEARLGIHPKDETVPPIRGVEGFSIRRSG